MCCLGITSAWRGALGLISSKTSKRFDSPTIREVANSPLSIFPKTVGLESYSYSYSSEEILLESLFSLQSSSDLALPRGTRRFVDDDNDELSFVLVFGSVVISLLVMLLLLNLLVFAKPWTLERKPWCNSQKKGKSTKQKRSGNKVAAKNDLINKHTLSIDGPFGSNAAAAQAESSQVKPNPITMVLVQVLDVRRDA
mmetsp:Transcript_23159/g.48572  ORF Transcript_23159/g.48572 Transcript_23159/m.48572 type:complete len:197 (-) Transcript_23159:41-631(-)